jgi:hypothetical protein
VAASLETQHNVLKIKWMNGDPSVTSAGLRKGSSRQACIRAARGAGFDVTKSEKWWSPTGKSLP